MFAKRCHMGTLGGKGLSNFTMHVQQNITIMHVIGTPAHTVMHTRLHIFLYFKFFIKYFGFTTE